MSINDSIIKPICGDLVRVSIGVFPEYPYCVFLVVGIIEFETRQICITPVGEVDPQKRIWINYDSETFTIITEPRQKEMINILYGHIKS